MSAADAILAAALDAPGRLDASVAESWLSSRDEGLWRAVYAAAREVKARCGRDRTLPRGLVECSNACAKDCLYCGIRRSSPVARYRMTEDEILACCDEARARGYPAVAFQAGEIECEANTALYERIVRAASRDLEVTLSLGEQEEGVYARWRAAGALRYLIRIETSNRRLYAAIHPASCSFDRRLGCIRTLKRLGYVTGTGVMIGLPGQTFGDLARDVTFFRDERVDMVGMGPYVPHPATPLAALPYWRLPVEPVELACRMVALTRLHSRDVNIVAASALDALAPGEGRERALASGANVIMPNLTPPRYREGYDLYPGKTSSDTEMPRIRED